MKPVVLQAPLGDDPPTATLFYGLDVLEGLRLLPDASVHTVCTSPPYWGLRDYQAEGQIGLEETLDEYVTRLVEVFREVARVLRPDGTLWLNLGDSYTSGGRTWRAPDSKDGKGAREMDVRPDTPPGLKPKDLVGIPWRVALALQADGWYLRSDIIWHKTNVMPESVRDRPTKAHEYVFLFAHPESGGRYFYDADALRELQVFGDKDRQKKRRPKDWKSRRDTHGTEVGGHRMWEEDIHKNDGWLAGSPADGKRNKRSVWTVATKPYPGAHFAVWPPKLVEPMVRAGTSGHGVCGSCGAPWRRLTEWEPGCVCGAAVVPATVLDPFSGSATTGMVALAEGRNYIGLDLNADFLPLAEARILGRKASRGGKGAEEDAVFDMFGA